MKVVMAVVAMGLIGAACGDTADSTAPQTVPTSSAGSTESDSTTTLDLAVPSSTATTSAPATTVGSTPSAPTTKAPAPTTTTAAPLPGESTDFGPGPGAVMAVVGVEHDDVLNVRNAPGVSGPIVTTLTPLRDDVVATGNNRLLTSSIWYEIEANGLTGWASGKFLAYLGGGGDVLADVVAELGAPPIADDFEALVALVAGTYSSTEPESRVTTAFGPFGDGPIVITVDVLDIGDDALLGYRVVILGSEVPEGGFVAQGIEVTFICSRGVSGDLCL